ncbi:major facilitator transporter [Chryseobacterium sp. StRB126]|uniref:MFS transporter n=1 Tax=Chryseobacterium sp. StRB126 TaxID=878220 RepID=UPI0004E98569|nr:MFS transporter [Chryseobacterium sp. StRB126]BAP31938.1 major facilitator transporter [Chryseobacterium sp. StRB126]
MQTKTTFTSYQKFVIFLLAITQFTVVLDFVVMSPLGDFMMKSLKITVAQFGTAVSAYAFSAGISGFLSAGFADKFDRKKLLLFFYIGFAIGTLFCAIAPTYELMIVARIFTGLFGGVISSISITIITDLFALNQRGKVIGFVQMGFSSSQIFGIPIGLFLANKFNWQIPFLWIAVMAFIIVILMLLKLKPIKEHLKIKNDKSPFFHLWHTISQKNYRVGFLNTVLLSIGSFLILTFSVPFYVNNLKISTELLPVMFMITGITIFVLMPLIGKLSDKIPKFKLFVISTLIAICTIIICSHYQAPIASWIVVLTNVIMMTAIMSRGIPSQALTSAIPKPQDRGAYMSIISSTNQVAGGFATILAGLIIVQKDNFSPLENYPYLAYTTSFTMLLTMYLVYRLNKIVEIEQH